MTVKIFFATGCGEGIAARVSGMRAKLLGRVIMGILITLKVVRLCLERFLGSLQDSSRTVLIGFKRITFVAKFAK